PLQVPLQRIDERGRQDGHAVLSALAVADDDLTVTEVDIFNAQAEALEDPHAGPVEKGRDEPLGTLEAHEEGAGFLSGEDDGEARWVLGADDSIEPLEGLVEDVAIEE